MNEDGLTYPESHSQDDHQTQGFRQKKKFGYGVAPKFKKKFC
jgi:hypothetical protein